MAQIPLKVMTDEHVANAASRQLVEKGVDAVRLIDIIEVGTSDPEVLEFAHANGYALVTLDKNMMRHIMDRTNAGLEHGGVFIGINLHGSAQVGMIVNFIVVYDQAIKNGAATVEGDVYNQVIYMS